MEIFHVMSRGVDKRKIFIDDQDRFRFVHDLFEFNDQASVNNLFFRFHQKTKTNDIASPYVGRFNLKTPRKPRKLLVNILAFCLMSNHYHLLLARRVEDGIPRFMKKLNIGYAKYFNERYERTGALFEGRYKYVAVSGEPHFIHLPYYIHLNPLDLKFFSWRDRELRDSRQAIQFLESYRWSSHLDYLGKSNFPSVTQRNLLMEFWGGSEGYRKAITEWLNDFDLGAIAHLLLEK